VSESFTVTVAAGSLRSPDEQSWSLPHRWSEEGVTVSASFTGAHLLHVAAAGCVLNDVYREAASLGTPVDGVRVTATGAFDETWASTGITYAVELDSPADAATLDRLLAVVDEVAEVPKALRAGTTVSRADAVAPDGRTR
jgi:uncharacterized OsmC-like protein